MGKKDKLWQHPLSTGAGGGGGGRVTFSSGPPCVIDILFSGLTRNGGLGGYTGADRPSSSTIIPAYK